MTRCAGAAPKEGPHPIWTGFLMDATGGDEDMLGFLQILVGYVLTGQTVEHVLAFLFGPGGNGKSVFLNVLTRLMGDYAVTAPMDAFAAAQGERHSTELAMLAGARLVTASETQEGRAWDEARIKAVSGGDPITARFMRQDNFTFKPRFKLLISGNFQPVLRNVDPAMRRRLLMLPFTRTPARPDPDLEQKIWGEAPAIMAWAIRGCLAWQDEGLPRPEAVTLATDTYFTDQDGFGEWLEASTEIGGAGSFAAAADLFASWKGFCEAAGERPGTAKTLGAKLRRRGLTNVARRIGGKPTKVWLGLSLRNGGVQ
jgi:putative DNA primase/helicase